MANLKFLPLTFGIPAICNVTSHIFGHNRAYMFAIRQLSGGAEVYRLKGSIVKALEKHDTYS